MKAIRKAVVDKLLPDAQLGALWGEQKIVSGWLPAQPVFPLTTITVATSSEDAEIPRRETLVDLNHWSKSADTNDDIAVRVYELLHKKPLPADGRRVQEVLEEISQPLFEPDTGLHRHWQQFRVIHFPA